MVHEGGEGEGPLITIQRHYIWEAIEIPELFVKQIHATVIVPSLSCDSDKDSAPIPVTSCLVKVSSVPGSRYSVSSLCVYS